MRLGIDAREIERGVRTGIGRALSVFLDSISGIDPDCRCVLFTTRQVPDSFDAAAANVVHPERSRLVWDQYVLPRLAAENECDVLYSPYYKIPLRCPCPAVSTIFDLMYIFCEVYRSRLSFFSRFYYRTVGTMMSRTVRAIVTCSEYSRDEIVRFYGVDPAKVHVIPLGLDPRYRPAADCSRNAAVRKRFGIGDDYIVYVGNFKPHKNVPRLVEAFGRIRQEDSTVQLVLAGAEDEHFCRVRQAVEGSGCRDAVIFTGTLTVEEQVILYSCARVCVVPSLYEGFGYPALEAMACGTPVVSSNRTSLPEIYGNDAVGIDPCSVEEIAEGILGILKNPERADDLGRRGRIRSEKFTAREYAVRLYDLIHSCAREHSTKR